jgi:Zn-dependent protease
MLITILSIVILIFSIIIHEISHGFMAEWLGDPTARLQGRLTLNPLKHIDLVGSIIVPLITSLSGFTFGWAKPVEYNPYNLRNKRWGEFWIGLAGPLSNILLALIFGTIIRFASVGATAMTPFLEICSYIVIINIILAVFNLIPLPPLDGSKLLLAFLPNQYGRFRRTFEMYAPIFILIVVVFLWNVISPIVPYIFRLVTGAGI